MLADLAMTAPPGAAHAGSRAEAAVAADARFDAAYREHAGFVWRVLRGMGVREPSVEDAVQDVFVVVHRRLPEFDGRCSIKTWLFEIAYRVACDYRRKHKRARGYDPLPEDVRDAAPGPAETAERRQALQTLADALDALSDEQRIVLVLTEIEGLTAPEIAAVTGTGLNTIYTRLRRARAAVEQRLRAAREQGA